MTSSSLRFRSRKNLIQSLEELHIMNEQGMPTARVIDFDYENQMVLFESFKGVALVDITSVHNEGRISQSTRSFFKYRSKAFKEKFPGAPWETNIIVNIETLGFTIYDPK